MLTLPDDARQEMIDYYAQNYAGTNEPSVMEIEDEYADFSPLIAADEFDYDSYGALYTLYFQVIDMLMG